MREPGSVTDGFVRDPTRAPKVKRLGRRQVVEVPSKNLRLDLKGRVCERPPRGKSSTSRLRKCNGCPGSGRGRCGHVPLQGRRRDNETEMDFHVPSCGPDPCVSQTHSKPGSSGDGSRVHEDPLGNCTCVCGCYPLRNLRRFTRVYVGFVVSAPGSRWSQKVRRLSRYDVSIITKRKTRSFFDVLERRLEVHPITKTIFKRRRR